LLNLLDKYDANHDGVLDQTELAKLRSDIQAGTIAPPRHGGGGPSGPPGGSDAGMHQPPSAKDLIKQFDTDSDGKLDEAELTAMLKFLHEHRPMHGPGGPGGPPPGDSAPQQ
jgi:Ca2+-binding EF-hand superfamily protein